MIMQKVLVFVLYFKRAVLLNQNRLFCVVLFRVYPRFFMTIQRFGSLTRSSKLGK